MVVACYFSVMPVLLLLYYVIVVLLFCQYGGGVLFRDMCVLCAWHHVIMML